MKCCEWFLLTPRTFLSLERSITVQMGYLRGNKNNAIDLLISEFNLYDRSMWCLFAVGEPREKEQIINNVQINNNDKNKTYLGEKLVANRFILSKGLDTMVGHWI